MLIKQEAGVPKEEGGGAWWSADHLFVTSDAVPVIVEVKRKSDTRIRREVIGQMLDYAANGTKYWAEPRAIFEARVAQDGDDPTQALSTFNPDLDPDAFWEDVSANLRSGHIRMVFVADELPPELVRIIEFLNEQMRDAEVLGIEVRQYVSGPNVLLVPRVFGNTTEAVVAKQSAHGSWWTEESFVEAAEMRNTPEEVGAIRTLLQHCKEHGKKLNWGSGVTPGVAAWYTVDGTEMPVWNLNVGGDGQGARPYVNLYLSGILAKLGEPRVLELVNLLGGVPVMAPLVEVARVGGFKGKGSAAPVYVADLAPDLNGFLSAVWSWVTGGSA